MKARPGPRRGDTENPSGRPQVLNADVDRSRAVCRVCGVERVLGGRREQPWVALALFSDEHSNHDSFCIDVVVGTPEVPFQRAG